MAKHLIARGEQALCADINLEALQKKHGDAAQLVYFDFTDSRTFNSALWDVDRVFIKFYRRGGYWGVGCQGAF